MLEASNGEEALRRFEADPGAIDLLLSDVVMPKMSGPVLAKRLSQARPGLKVLCMSGFTDDLAVRHGVRDGELAFIQKPIAMVLDGPAVARQATAAVRVA